MTARDWLEMVRHASSRIEDLQRELSGLLDAKRDCVPWTTGSGGGGTAHTHSDPTASRAMGRAGLDAEIAKTQAELDRCVALVGEFGQLLGQMRVELGPRHADAMEVYYVDGAATWTEVADEMDMSRRAACRLRDTAIWWITCTCPRFRLY